MQKIYFENNGFRIYARYKTGDMEVVVGWIKNSDGFIHALYKRINKLDAYGKPKVIVR